MQQLASFLSGAWQSSRGRSHLIHHAISGEVLWRATNEGLDMVAARPFAVEKGAPAFHAMTFTERAAMLKTVTKHLLGEKERFYAPSAQTGVTRADSWVDIKGGIGTLFTYASLDSQELPDDILWPGDELIPLSKEGGFTVRHVLTSKSDVAVHVSAFNFPYWGMLERLAPTRLGGVPAIIEPAAAIAQLTQAMVKSIADNGPVPRGAISLVRGSAGDLLNHLDSQDAVTFTGSAAAGQMLRVQSNIVAKSIPFIIEADSLNCYVLSEDVAPDQPEFALSIREVVREITTKTGQKYTAIRRIVAPQTLVNAVSDALVARLQKVMVGDPAQEGMKMGALVNAEQRADMQEKANVLLVARCEVRLGGQADLSAAGAFLPSTLLYCPQPDETPAVHATEALDPIMTLMPTQNQRHALQLACAGGGSLAGTLVTANSQIACQFIADAARAHRRIQIFNEESARESTEYGSPLPQLIHGEPGRTGGDEELGGLQAMKRYMQRTAIQGSPMMLATISKQWVRGAKVEEDRIHPFRKYFEELQPGDSLLTPHRTIIETDIVNFACLSDDHFYTHMDKIAAAESIFGERVVHGYFVFSAAAGLFVGAGVGPAIANYGLESLCFIEPVEPGDTIQVRLICKHKTLKKQCNAEEKPTGVVEWAVEVFNQY